MFLLELIEGNVNKMENGQNLCHRVLVRHIQILYTDLHIISLAVVTVELANESFSVIEGNTVRRVCVVKNGSAPVAFDVTITPVVTSPIEANRKSLVYL